ncbi:MAG TPA: hypothetical protein VGM88_03800 [Kofleriaceae bacterium]
MTARLSPEILRFLDEVLDTHDKVEIACLVASRPCTAAELAARAALALDRDAFRDALRDLIADGVVRSAHPDAPLELGPRTRDPSFSEIVRLHAEDPLLLMNASTALSIRRVRSMAARTFRDTLGAKKGKR